LLGEGDSAAGWGIGGSVELLLWVQSLFRQWAATNHAAAPTASAGQYAFFELWTAAVRVSL